MKVSMKRSFILKADVNLELEVVESTHGGIADYRVNLCQFDPFKSLCEWQGNADSIKKVLDEAACMFIKAGNALINDMKVVS